MVNRLPLFEAGYDDMSYVGYFFGSKVCPCLGFTADSIRLPLCLYRPVEVFFQRTSGAVGTAIAYVWRLIQFRTNLPLKIRTEFPTQLQMAIAAFAASACLSIAQMCVLAAKAIHTLIESLAESASLLCDIMIPDFP